MTDLSSRAADARSHHEMMQIILPITTAISDLSTSMNGVRSEIGELRKDVQHLERSNIEQDIELSRQREEILSQAESHATMAQQMARMAGEDAIRAEHAKHGARQAATLTIVVALIGVLAAAITAGPAYLDHFQKEERHERTP